MLREIILPDIGDFDAVPVVEIYVKLGDTVEVDAPMMALESDKATMDVPAPFAGRVVELLVSLGSVIGKGALIARIETDESGEVVDRGERHAAGEILTAAHTEVMPQAPVADGPHAGPSARKLARELDVVLGEVTGTGPKGRILPEDVRGHGRKLAQAPVVGLPAWPIVDFEKFGVVTRMPLARLRRLSGPNLARNWVSIPHVTNFDEADITALDEFRKEVNEDRTLGEARVTLVAFAIKIVASALTKHPEFNSSLVGDTLILKHYYNIGLAVDTDQGLVVPVIKAADKKSVLEIASEVERLASDARSGKLKSSDNQGATFTISSLGGVGGTGFTPIINAPEVALLGLSRSRIQPVWDGTVFAPRLTLPLSLGWDHRVADGAGAQRFLNTLVAFFENFARVLV